MRRRRSRKRNRTAVLGVMLGLGLALSGAGAAGAAGAAGVHFTHCGTLRGPGARFAVLAYRARCATARRVFAALFAGKGRRRSVAGKIDRVIDGWICGSGAGGFGCGKLGPHGTILPYKPGQPVIDAEAAGPAPAPAVTKGPPCTRKALAAGLKRGANKLPGDPIEGWRCADGWAIAVVLDGVDDVPALFHARGNRWFTVDREKPCATHAVPKKIYAPACMAS